MEKKLSKLKMPMGKPMEEEMSLSELDMESEPRDEEMPMPEGEEMPSEPSMLADVSDEELLAEMKKRGLSKELDMEEGEMESEEEDELA